MPWVPIEKTPPPPQLRIEESWWSRAISYVARVGWAWRLELTIVLSMSAVAALVARRVAPVAAALATAVVFLILALLPPLRRALLRWEHVASTRRRWARACRHAGLETANARVPRIVSIRRLVSGDVCRVKVPAGGNVTALEQSTETLAAALGLREVRVARDRLCGTYAEVVLAKGDPLADPTPLDWPDLLADRLSLWDPVTVGVDENREPLTVSMVERNILIGGEPGAGKSAAASLLLATAALDPSVKLWLFDGKLVELAVWQRCAERVLDFHAEPAITALEELQAEMNVRYRTLLTADRRKVESSDGLPLYLVAIDELALYLNGEDRKQDRRFANLLRDLVSRGRAAGIIVVGATQKPAADVMPSAIRDLFGFRWAMRCSTRDASDTILGAGWASLDYNAATIDPACRGVGLLLAEGGVPVRCKSYYLSDDQLRAVAQRAARLRGRRADDESPALAVA